MVEVPAFTTANLINLVDEESMMSTLLIPDNSKTGQVFH